MGPYENQWKLNGTLLVNRAYPWVSNNQWHLTYDTYWETYNIKPKPTNEFLDNSLVSGTVDLYAFTLTKDGISEFRDFNPLHDKKVKSEQYFLLADSPRGYINVNYFTRYLLASSEEKFGIGQLAVGYIDKDYGYACTLVQVTDTTPINTEYFGHGKTTYAYDCFEADTNWGVCIMAFIILPGVFFWMAMSYNLANSSYWPGAICFRILYVLALVPLIPMFPALLLVVKFMAIFNHNAQLKELSDLM